MTIWLVCAVLTSLMLLLMILPLIRRQAALTSRVEYDIVVYRDQLGEVARDRDQGLLSDEQAGAVRTEILRRMLAAEDAENTDIPPGDHRLSRRTRHSLIVILLLGLPAATLAIYSQLGTPGLPNQPIAERREDPAFSLLSLASEMAARLQEDPSPEGYQRLAATYSSAHRYDQAARAYREALQMTPGDGEIWSRLGETLTLGKDGNVGPEAVQAFTQAVGADAADARARFYLGLAKVQTGELRQGVAIWRDLEKDGSNDSSWMPMLKEHIANYARQGGFDPASIPPAPPQRATESAPTADAVTDEQKQFILSMVEKLAAKLGTTPDDVEGWMRLGRAYKVLGQADKAKLALSKAVALRPKDVAIRISLAEIQLDEGKDGVLTAELVKNMREVLAIEPDNVDALYYVGEAEHQAGHAAQAKALWQKALSQLAPDSVERTGIQRQMDALGK